MSTAGVTRCHLVQGVGAVGLATADHAATKLDQPLCKQASADVITSCPNSVDLKTTTLTVAAA